MIMLIHGLDIRIVDTLAGELLRDLTLNRDRDCQPQNHEDTPDP